MAFPKTAPAALMAVAIAGLLFNSAAQSAGGIAVHGGRGQRASMRTSVATSMAGTVPPLVAPGPVTTGEPRSRDDHCNNVPVVCTPSGWVVGSPFPVHPKNAFCCETIRNAGIECLCKLWQVWKVPIETVRGYRKDCKLLDSLICPQ